MTGTLTTERRTPTLAPAPARLHRGAILFLGLLLYQTFHQLEHTIETTQLQILHHREAHTLIGGADFEWIHFGANFFLLWGLVGVMLGAGAANRARWRSSFPLGWSALCLAVTVQGYHMLEHSVRIVQYLTSGGDDPPGIVTTVLNPVWFHFGINLTVLVAMYVAFFGLGIHRSLGSRRPT
ncbi:MAG: hypothetical protein ACRDZW_11475 [Acidimicrobiales bacterium]